MAVKYLAGERIQGTAAERAALSTGTDTMGTGANGTAISDPTFVAAGDTNGVAMPSGFGAGAKSMYFDGDDAININGAEPFSTTVGTISFWYYNTGTEESKTILCFGDTNANTFMTFETREDGNDVIVCANFESGSENWEIRNAGSLSTSAWHHCAASQNGTTVVLYIDGVELTSWNNQTDKSKWIISALDNARIGCRNNNNSGDAGFLTGNVTEVALWNVALTEAQVQSLYGNGGSTAKKADTIPTGLRAYYDGSSLANAVEIVYPNLPNGTIFEESDTGKHYMFDGTSAWNEMPLYDD